MAAVSRSRAVPSGFRGRARALSLSLKAVPDQTSASSGKADIQVAMPRGPIDPKRPFISANLQLIEALEDVEVAAGTSFGAQYR
jgi:hypothetical protein